LADIFPTPAIIATSVSSPEIIVPPYVFKGYKFNGTSQYITVADNAALRPASFVTLECRMKLTVALASQPQPFLFMVQRTSGTQGYTLYIDRAANALVMQLFTGAGTNRFVTFGSLSTSYVLTEWHHYAGQYDGDKVNLYIDGVKVAASASFGAVTINYIAGTALTIAAQGASRFVQGYFDDVRVWSTNRTTQQIYDNRLAEINNPVEPGLAAYWKLNEDSGTVADDFISTNDGTLINTPTRQIYIFKELAEIINFSANGITRAVSVSPGIINFTANGVTLIKGAVTVATTPAVANFSAQTPVLELIQHMTASVINFIVAAETIHLTQHATPSVITLSLPPPVTLFTIHPIPAVATFSANGIDILLIIYPNPAVATFSANGVKANFTIYPTPAVATFSTNGIVVNYILYPNPAVATFSANGVKANFTIYPTPAVATFSANGIVPLITIYPTPAVATFSANGIVVDYVLYPDPCVIVFTAHGTNLIKPMSVVLTFSVPSPTMINSRVRVQFGVKIFNTINHRVIVE
jgi:hypothetical protein